MFGEFGGKTIHLDNITNGTETWKSNKALYGIQDNRERYALISWCIAVVVSSLIGDSLILLGTIKFGAIKLHKVLVAVIQHLAVCDLLLAIFNVSLRTVALVADDWVLGQFMGRVQYEVTAICFPVIIMLTCLLTISKLVILKRPLRAAALPARFGHKICTVMWITSVCLNLPIIILQLTKRVELKFQYLVYGCISGHPEQTPIWFEWYFYLTVFLFPVPCLIILITSSLILVEARKVATRQREVLRCEGVFTVMLTVGIFLLSFLPYFVTNIVQPQIFNVFHPPVVHRMIHFLTNLNIMTNFMVYSLTVKSFRNFLKNDVLRCFRRQKTTSLANSDLPEYVFTSRSPRLQRQSLIMPSSPSFRKSIVTVSSPGYQRRSPTLSNFGFQRNSLIPSSPDYRRNSPTSLVLSPTLQRNGIAPSSPDFRRNSPTSLVLSPTFQGNSIVPSSPDLRRNSPTALDPTLQKSILIPSSPQIRKYSLTPSSPGLRRRSPTPDLG